MWIFRLRELDCISSNTQTCTILAESPHAARQHAADILANIDWLDPDCVDCVDITDATPNPCLIEILDEPE
jgi:hypothetical protein